MEQLQNSFRDSTPKAGSDRFKKSEIYFFKKILSFNRKFYESFRPIRISHEIFYFDFVTIIIKAIMFCCI